MNNSKAVSALGLCRKAGKLIMGFDAVAQCVGQGEASLVVAASDISAKTGKEIAFLAKRQSVPVMTVPATMNELWTVLGKRVGIVAVTDTGLAGAVSSALNRKEEETL